MGTKIKILNGTPEITVEEITVGSRFGISLYVERETSVTNVFEPFDSTGFSMAAYVKSREKDADSSKIEEFAVVARPAPDLGWFDLELTGAQTTSIGTATGEGKTVYGSLKVWPTGDTAAGETLAAFIMGVKYRAVR